MKLLRRDLFKAVLGGVLSAIAAPAAALIPRRKREPQFDLEGPALRYYELTSWMEGSEIRSSCTFALAKETVPPIPGSLIRLVDRGQSSLWRVERTEQRYGEPVRVTCREPAVMEIMIPDHWKRGWKESPFRVNWDGKRMDEVLEEIRSMAAR